MARAARLAATIKAQLDLEPELTPGSRGALEIYVDNELLFSRLNTGRFPEEREVITALQARE